MSRIYILEKEAHKGLSVPPDGESSPLLDASDREPDAEFKSALDTELEKIASFYRLKELEVYREFQELQEDEESYLAESEGPEGDSMDKTGASRSIGKGRPRRSSLFQSLGLSGRSRRASTLSASVHNLDTEIDSEDDDVDETAALQQQTGRRATIAAGAELHDGPEGPTKRRRPSTGYNDFQDQMLSALYSSGITLKKRSISLYVNLCELKSFIQLNKTGFAKALKKYDKILDRDLKIKYMATAVTPAYPFEESTMQELTERIGKIEKIYAAVVTKGDIATSKR